MRSLASSSCLVCVLWVLGCPGAAAPGEGEGEGGEGEGEGEGEGASIAYAFERSDGSVLANDLLELGAHDTADAPTVVDLLLANTGAVDFALLTEPPLLVAGTDAAFFSVVTQPADVVHTGTAVPFTIQYAPTSAGAHEGKLLFAWGEETSQRVVLTVRATATGTSTSPGVRYAIFDGTFTTLPDFTTLGATETGVVPTFDISARAGTDAFAFTFDGAVNLDAPGTWTFFTTSDDGSRLSIDGVVVVDNDGVHGPVEVSGTAALTAGLHAIHVEFFEGAGGESLVVEWQPPGGARAAIPADHLFTNDI